MLEEKIKINSHKKITVSTYFSNVDVDFNILSSKLNNASIPKSSITSIWNSLKENGTKAYVIKDSNNGVLEFVDIVEGSYCKRLEGSNDYRFLNDNELSKVVEGKIYSIYHKKEISDNLKQQNRERFRLESVLYSGNTSVADVIYKTESKNDYNVDLCIHRSIDTLDTLSVKNNSLSEYPKQQSETGVVMGTLFARQKIKDENGENVLIPLSNVPIVIFNESEDFPSTSSTDIDGNRLTLNIIQNSNREDYADTPSYVLDIGKRKAEENGLDLDLEYNDLQPLLKDYNTINVPEQYKYSTITNEKGEFIIQDIPIGNQFLMFEVDLLKQGMTKDEVALNFYPYSVDENVNVDSVPHFYFRRIPISVTPSWGDFQTGYTEVNITANIDMRKWTTYFVPPVSIRQGDSINSIDELSQIGRSESLNIYAIDMTKQDFPFASEFVEISNLEDRVQTQNHEWFNEFKIRKNSISFNKTEFHAFKLPSNLYDPNGKPSDGPGRLGLKNRKGVWLSSYQFKMFYGNDNSSYRATNLVRNLNDNFQEEQLDNITNNYDLANVGDFPFDKPWTINYPEPYSIPKMPVQQNSNKDYSQIYEPRYFDGDLVGFYYGQEESTGYGLMSPSENTSSSIYNRFAQLVTKASLYKYEKDTPSSEWSNGFRFDKHNDTLKNIRGRDFEVKDGERYQRVESGFMYFLKPEGWGRIGQFVWGDKMINSDILTTNNSSDFPISFFPKTYFRESMERNGESISLILGDYLNSENRGLKVGSLDIYRIIQDSPNFLSPLRPYISQKELIIKIGNTIRGNKRLDPQVDMKFGNGNEELSYDSNMKVLIKNLGVLKTKVSVLGVTKDLLPREEAVLFDVNAGDIRLSTNAGLDVNTSSYLSCKYSLTFYTDDIEKSGRVSETINIDRTFNENDADKTLYLMSRAVEAEGNIKLKNNGDFKIKSLFTYEASYRTEGVMLISPKSRTKMSYELFEDDLTTIARNVNRANNTSSAGGFLIQRL
jgi:hypothetical protein